MGGEIPQCVLTILEVTGFDEKIALKTVNVDEIQNFLQENWLTFRNKFKGTAYANEETFKILPGHRHIISNLPNVIGDIGSDDSGAKDWSSFSVVLQSLIETAESNANKEPKQHRYNEIIRYFSTYLYLMSGKSCYETLSANLPIPKASTICKKKHHFHFNRIHYIKKIIFFSELHST